LPQLLEAAMAAAHELVVRELGLLHADGTDVAPRRERLALAPPDARAHLAPVAQLTEDLEQTRVHLVVERVVLLGTVVGDRGDRSTVLPLLDLESDSFRHAFPLARAVTVSSADVARPRDARHQPAERRVLGP